MIKSDFQAGDIIRITSVHWGLDVDDKTLIVEPDMDNMDDEMAARYLLYHPDWGTSRIVVDPEQVEKL